MPPKSRSIGDQRGNHTRSRHVPSAAHPTGKRFSGVGAPGDAQPTGSVFPTMRGGALSMLSIVSLLSGPRDGLNTVRRSHTCSAGPIPFLTAALPAERQHGFRLSPPIHRRVLYPVTSEQGSPPGRSRPYPGGSKNWSVPASTTDTRGAPPDHSRGLGTDRSGVESGHARLASESQTGPTHTKPEQPQCGQHQHCNTAARTHPHRNGGHSKPARPGGARSSLASATRGCAVGV